MNSFPFPEFIAFSPHSPALSPLLSYKLCTYLSSLHMYIHTYLHGLGMVGRWVPGVKVNERPGFH